MSESDFDLIEGSGTVFRELDDTHADLKQAGRRSWQGALQYRTSAKFL